VAVLVGPDRRITAREAVNRCGAQALVLDDGFQHLRLARDLDIVTVDVRNPLGNGHCLPRGLLREPPRALRDAGLVLLTRASRSDPGRVDSLRARIGRYGARAPVLAASHSAVKLSDLSRGSRRPVEDLQDLKILAFAGIGNPQAFFQDLAGLGSRVLDAVPFPDHHVYTRESLDRLLKWARLMNADALVTTEKDAVRLAPFLPVEETLLALGIELELLEGEDLFREAVLRAVRRH
jgi:tetraacyldisaccharide 4'-kinase